MNYLTGLRYNIWDKYLPDMFTQARQKYLFLAKRKHDYLHTLLFVIRCANRLTNS